MNSEPQLNAQDRGRRSLPMRALRVVLIAAMLLVLLPYALAPIYRVVDPVSTIMLWRWARVERVERAEVPIDRIAPSLPRAVIAAEDDKFCSHHGVDFGELRLVLRAEAAGAHRVRGGSSLTQQLAKNLFLWPGRSYVRKALELPLALWIDFVIPKRRQMEIYLNVAQWGPSGEFGAEAAARRAFGKPASALSPGESAMLAATLPNPIRRNAKSPIPMLRRLAATYTARSAARGDIDRCVKPARPA